MTSALKRWAEYCRQNDFAMLGSMLVLAFALSLLAGCAGENQPVVTDDDLTPGSAVDAALSLDAGNGKTYSYVWADSDPEELAEVILGMTDQVSVIENRQAYFEMAIAQGEDYLRQSYGGLSMEEAQQEYEYYKSGAALEEFLQEAVSHVQAQLALDPVVSPQEAANRAGVLFEESYGISLSDKTLLLDCRQTDPSEDIMHKYNGRMVWSVIFAWPNADGELVCMLDATTGEWIEAGYLLSEDERQAMLDTPLAGFLIPPEPRVDKEDPSYIETVEAEKAKVVKAFAKSSLADGAAITEVRAEDSYSRLAFYITCDNGKTYRLLRDDNYFEYDFGGYPLRAYGITNVEFLP